ncbi:hypothetical protein ACFPYJ_20235 [Paenibacillus solisilvae]|uniref:Aspartyl-phosphate phosphatase Spo0E family protein n=1 Tax=Paenibacillus solisilvae TaxID=2486751 RepID=A0ABW0W133_9BACL
MRSEDQIKSKLIQLKSLNGKNLEVEKQIEILEWVLNEPTEKYHNK